MKVMAVFISFIVPLIIFATTNNAPGTLKSGPEVLQQEEIKYVGLSIRRSEKNPVKDDMKNLWASFNSRKQEIQDATGETLALTGVVERIGDDRMSNYVASARVKEFSNIPTGMVSGKIPEGAYIKFVHKGPMSKLYETLNYVQSIWLPKSNYSTSGIIVEFYAKDAVISSPQLEVTIYMPATKKK